MTTEFDLKPSILLLTNFRNFSKPSIEDVYESNAFQVFREHKDLKGVVFFDGSKNQLYLSDCFANAATKKIIRDTGIKPERKMRSIVLSCIKEHLKEHHYVEQLNRSSVINVWTLEDFLEILNRIKLKKYSKPKFDIGSITYFKSLQEHFQTRIKKQTLESDILDAVHTEFMKHRPKYSEAEKARFKNDIQQHVNKGCTFGSLQKNIFVRKFDFYPYLHIMLEKSLFSNPNFCKILYTYH